MPRHSQQHPEKLSEKAVLRHREACLIEDVWFGQIDQMTTSEIAEQYRLDPWQALKVLKEITTGAIVDLQNTSTQIDRTG